MSDQSEDVSTLWSHFDLSLSQHYPESDQTITSKEDPGGAMGGRKEGRKEGREHVQMMMQKQK